jgi:hypothetical protein
LNEKGRHPAGGEKRPPKGGRYETIARGWPRRMPPQGRAWTAPQFCKSFCSSELRGIILAMARLMANLELGQTRNFLTGLVLDRLWRPWLEATSN